MRTGHRRPSRSAFTLIEWAAVISILSIMAVAVGGPALSYIDSIRAQAAAARVAGDIRYAQKTALSSGLRTWVLFSTTDNSYRLYVEDAANPGKANRRPAINPLDHSTGVIQFGSGEFVNVSVLSVDIGRTSELEFDTFGVPYNGNGTALTADGVIGLSGGVSVTIHPVGGLVERAG